MGTPIGIFKNYPVIERPNINPIIIATEGPARSPGIITENLAISENPSSGINTTVITQGIRWAIASFSVSRCASRLLLQGCSGALMQGALIQAETEVRQTASF